MSHLDLTQIEYKIDVLFDHYQKALTNAEGEKKIVELKKEITYWREQKQQLMREVQLRNAS